MRREGVLDYFLDAVFAESCDSNVTQKRLMHKYMNKSTGNTFKNRILFQKSTTSLGPKFSE